MILICVESRPSPFLSRILVPCPSSFQVAPILFHFREKYETKLRWKLAVRLLWPFSVCHVAFFFRRMTLTIPRFLQPHLCVLWFFFTCYVFLDFSYDFYQALGCDLNYSIPTFLFIFAKYVLRGEFLWIPSMRKGFSHLLFLHSFFSEARVKSKIIRKCKSIFK